MGTADALSALWTLYPGLRDRVLTEQGNIRQHINVFIGDEDIRYSGGLRSPVLPGSEIAIVPSISGGFSDVGTGLTQGESTAPSKSGAIIVFIRSGG